MDRKQKIAIGALPVLTVSMTVLYRMLGARYGRQRAWYLGFPVYWAWAISLTLALIGFKSLRALFAFTRPTALTWAMLIVPNLLSLANKSTNRHSVTRREKSARVITALMNGIVEEMLWRGVYITLFPNNRIWSMIYPTIWFALWHYAPGSVSPLTDVRVLMAGAGVYGALLSWLSIKTRSIGWAVVSHTSTSLIQALK